MNNTLQRHAAHNSHGLISTEEEDEEMFPCALDVAISPAVDVAFSAAAALAVVTSGVVVVVVVLHGKSTHNIASFFARLLFGSLVLVPSLATYSNRSISLLTKTPECSMLENHKHSFAELTLILDIGYIET